jgi:hypothetical protein
VWDYSFLLQPDGDRDRHRGGAEDEEEREERSAKLSQRSKRTAAALSTAISAPLMGAISCRITTGTGTATDRLT